MCDSVWHFFIFLVFKLWGIWLLSNGIFIRLKGQNKFKHLVYLLQKCINTFDLNVFYTLYFVKVLSHPFHWEDGKIAAGIHGNTANRTVHGNTGYKARTEFVQM